MKNASKLLLIMLSTASLAACSHYSEELSTLDKEMGQPQAKTAMAVSPQNIQPAAGAPITGMTPQSKEVFLQYLARDYYDLARAENDQAFDYKSSRDFTNKAAIASEGNFVVPSKISSYSLAPERAADLATSRTALIGALKTQNSPENAQTLAKAQSRFDCWIERAEEATGDKHFAQCKADFEQAMAALVTPAAGDETAGSVYKIAFAKESALMEPASQKDVDYVASILRDPKNEAYSVTLTGYTDDASIANNVAAARITAITNSLAEKGIEAARISPVVAPATMNGAEPGSVTLTLITPAATGPNVTTKTEFVPITPVTVPPTTPAR